MVFNTVIKLNKIMFHTCKPEKQWAMLRGKGLETVLYYARFEGLADVFLCITQALIKACALPFICSDNKEKYT
jgi:hypothetical protein